MRLKRLGVALIFALVAAACGGSDSSEAESVAIDETSTTVTESSLAATAVDEVETEADAIDFPPPALPIKQVHEFDQTIFWFVARAGRLWADQGQFIVRFDPDTGEHEEALLPGPDDLHAALFWFAESDSVMIAAADTTSPGSLDIAIAFDTDTFERLGTLRMPFPSNVLPGNERTANGFLAGKDFVGGYELNTSTMTLSDEPLFDHAANEGLASVSDDYWLWGTDGTVRIYDSKFELRDTFDTHRDATSQAAYVDDASVWYFHGATATLMRADRATHETLEIDLSGRYGEDVHLSLVSRLEDLELPLVVARADTADTGSFYILLRFDPETGEILSEHTVADASFDYGWNWGSGVDVSVDGGRVFIQDHPRRIVEIDIARLDDENLDPWVAPLLAWQPQLTEEEREVGELLLAMLDFEPIASTDPELYDLAIPALMALVDENSLDGWEVDTATIDGDRAWANAVASNGVTAGAAFTRGDGSWILDVRGVCYLTYAVSNPCEY